jgi:hypothetical protein
MALVFDLGDEDLMPVEVYGLEPQPLGPIDTGDEGSVADYQSYSWILCSYIETTLRADPFFTNFTIRRVARAVPIQGTQVPFLGIYLDTEKLGPDGDINHGDIRFTHNVPISFQIILVHNTPATLLEYIDRTSWYIMRALLRKDELTNRLKSGLPGNTRFEGIPSGRIRDRWGVTGAKNETPLGERQLELTFLFKTDWSPFGFSNLDRMVVRTGFPGPGSTPEEQAQIQQVTMVYDFSQPKESDSGRSASNTENVDPDRAPPSPDGAGQAGP